MHGKEQALGERRADKPTSRRADEAGEHVAKALQQGATGSRCGRAGLQQQQQQRFHRREIERRLNSLVQAREPRVGRTGNVETALVDRLEAVLSDDGPQGGSRLPPH